MTKRTLSPLLLLPLLAACGGDGSDATPDASSADTSSDAAVDTASDGGSDATADAGGDDVTTIGDIGRPDGTSDEPCDQDFLREAWPLNRTLAVGDGVEVTEDGGVYTAVIDASAGGTQAARGNAFVYLDLDGAAQVEISDVESLEDGDWELGFRRSAIRLNSSYSGPASLEMTRLTDTSLDAVTEVPDDSADWQVDDTYSRTCELRYDPIGTPVTAMNLLNGDNPTGSESWYEYGPDGVSPAEGDVYVVRDTLSARAWKFEIVSWVTGVYTIRFAPLGQ